MTRCLKCRGTVTNLSLIPVITSHTGVSPGGTRRELSVYELSSYGSTLAFLRRAFTDVTESEYFPGRPLGTPYAGILNQDVQNLTFPDARFDLVTSNQVFEHVPDDRRAYAECARVLRPGGALIFSVPLYPTRETIQLARVAGGDIQWLGQPEYHDSRTDGPRSAPVFWRHSQNDICARVATAGFRDVRLVDVTVAACQRVPAQVVYAVK